MAFILDLDNNDENFFETDLSNCDRLQTTSDRSSNPYYIKNNNQIELSKDIYYKYSRVLGLCLKNEISENNTSTFDIRKIYNMYTSNDELQELTKYFTLVPISLKVINNKFHQQCVLNIKKEILQMFTNISLESEELVIPFPDINEKQLKVYSTLYESDYDFNSILMGYTLYQYYNCETYKNIVLERLSRMTTDLRESNYWSNPYHCMINITEVFSNRFFRFKEKLPSHIKASINSNQSGIQDPVLRNTITKIFGESTAKSEYDLNDNNIYRKMKFTDASSGITKKGKNYKLYRIDNTSCTLSKGQINELFQSTSDMKLLFNLFNSLLLSKEYCHLAINNPVVLTTMKPFFQNKFSAFYNYIFAYAWMCMYLEECIVKTRTKNTNRYVFEINTASQLPFFPYCHENIHLNPYCALLVDEQILSSNDNCHGIPMIINYKEYGIDTQSGFINKMNIFTSGKQDISIFDGLSTISPTSKKWKHFAVGGSIIPACAQKKSPLVDLVSTYDMSHTEKYTRFFNEYYSESDIDIMCNSNSVFQFMDNVNELVNVIKTNLVKLNGSSQNIAESVNIETHKSLCILINTKFIELEMNNFGTVDHIINNLTSPEIKERFYEEYFSIKRDNNKKNRKEYSGSNNKLYEEFYKIVSIDDMNIMITTYEPDKDHYSMYDSDTCIFLNDILPKDQQVSSEKNIQVMRISENIKFKIKSPYLKHSLEVFRTKYPDYFSCVARFHLPCVRGYFDGETTYLLPSCVTALMTFTNIDYKYFSGSKDPIEIINKYRMRGFGTIINDREKSSMVKYNNSIEKWKKLLAFSTDKKYMGPTKVNTDLFKPIKTLNLPITIPSVYRTVDFTYVTNLEEYYNYFKNNYGYDSKTSRIDFLKFSAIKPDGNIEQLKRWVLESAFDELSK
ncbi:hypothetical protein Indivirus_3_33 [Indivirus ILV1]|uniref:Uncharacterized protein n=1 Tax=Indivirus ILV1 TaxID=1977633 RepID=A0A1V0SDS8_9VIRU|nr:hypothetical protein Indivirus_3_33 [Indivirus ILV1]